MSDLLSSAEHKDLSRTCVRLARCVIVLGLAVTCIGIGMIAHLLLGGCL